jgi:hypothetical protein
MERWGESGDLTPQRYDGGLAESEGLAARLKNSNQLICEGNYRQYGGPELAFVFRSSVGSARARYVVRGNFQ